VQIRDLNGENPVTRIITHIDNDEQGTVTLLVGGCACVRE
jgi:hypothetical protein